ncbi:hypothetical protein [Chitinophaga sp. 22620]|uniref:hypothetical protein n=1 Tax=Chitinophaga sp. 22620 TaxID=3453952 RepID=UPI003F867D5D
MQTIAERGYKGLAQKSFIQTEVWGGIYQWGDKKGGMFAGMPAPLLLAFPALTVQLPRPTANVPLNEQNKVSR